MDQKEKLEELKCQLSNERARVARALSEGTRAPGDAGLYFCFHSQEAEELRMAFRFLTTQIANVNARLQDIQRKEAESKK